MEALHINPEHCVISILSKEYIYIYTAYEKSSNLFYDLGERKIRMSWENKRRRAERLKARGELDVLPLTNNSYIAHEQLENSFQVSLLTEQWSKWKQSKMCTHTTARHSTSHLILKMYPPHISLHRPWQATSDRCQRLMEAGRGWSASITSRGHTPKIHTM